MACESGAVVAELVAHDEDYVGGRRHGTCRNQMLVELRAIVNHGRCFGVGRCRSSGKGISQSGEITRFQSAKKEICECLGASAAGLPCLPRTPFVICRE